MIVSVSWLLACGDPTDRPDDDTGAAQATPAAEVARFAGCTATIERRDAGDDPFEAGQRRYDAWGWRIEVADDYDLDGNWDAREGWTRDRWGNTLEAFVFDDAGERHVTFRGEYDAEGNPVHQEWDLDGDGVVDVVRDSVSDGGLLRSAEEDVDADGTVDNTFTYTYDALDRLVAFASEPVSAEGVSIADDRAYDGDSDRIVSWSYVATDEDGDVLLDWQYRWTWDDLGRLATESRDEDGALAEVVWTYDGDAPEPETSTETESAGLVTETAYTYDDAWREVLRVEVYVGAGELHESTTWDCP